ncbi:MAG: VTT domain-containing protein [Legionellales bacterium]|nr:VTT domain-containing protein [Legionellales bacterium]
MHLFSEYIQPLSFWLYAHPHWALFMTFIISFAESLAIIGSIVPGSITMTAVGILAGSGVMRIDLTLIAASLGAIAGDSGSYALGYAFSDRLINTWPFKNYPSWITYGKDYFTRHGSASILIGRFVGPMRSIIPVIAGMMHMNQWHFLCANTLSGIAWSFLYVLPGFFIGQVSTELSPESASRLFALILIVLGIIWLSTLIIKWTLKHLHRWSRDNFHMAWSFLQSHPRMGALAKKMVPPHEVNHYPTALLMLLWWSCCLLSILIISLVIQLDWVANINGPIYLFFQSIQVTSIAAVCIVFSLILSPWPITLLLATRLIYTHHCRDLRTFRYELSLVLMTASVLLFLCHVVMIPQTYAHVLHHAKTLFPDVGLAYATALLTFHMLYLNTFHKTAIRLGLQLTLLSVLCLTGFATIYLGDNWLTSVLASYLIGLSLSLPHWIFYRRLEQPSEKEITSFLLPLTFMLIAGIITSALYFNKALQSHTRALPQHIISNGNWWNQQEPLLPIYSSNRFGKRREFLNIQYVGSLKKLQKALEKDGWKHQPDSFFYSLLMRAGGHPFAEGLPLMAQLYQNQKPSLVMIYHPKEVLLILRLWRSNYHLHHYHQPIWIGSVTPIYPTKNMGFLTPKITLNEPIAAFHTIKQALPSFQFNQINLVRHYIEKYPEPSSPILLMIKDPDM